MLDYNGLYEILRKEKYSEVLQLLPGKFVEEVSEYLKDRKDHAMQDDGVFGEASLKSKKQLENSIAMFKELMLRRKKKLLNLVFVATETGIMKRDYENMLAFEKEMFDVMVKALEDGDKKLGELLRGQEKKNENAMVVFDQDVEKFVGGNGEIVGPFSSGDLANLDSGVGQILVEGGKARFVDES